MPDYSHHKMQDWEWYSHYHSRMGREAFEKYFNQIHTLLHSMQPGSFFSIEKNVKPDNRDLFIKMCCMIFRVQLVGNDLPEYYYDFSLDYTEIRCKKIVGIKKMIK